MLEICMPQLVNCRKSLNLSTIRKAARNVTTDGTKMQSLALFKFLSEINLGIADFVKSKH